MFIARRWMAFALVIYIVAPIQAAELNKYLPDDTEIVFGIDVAALLNSGLIKKHGTALLKLSSPKFDDEWLKALADKKDIVHRVLIGTSAEPGDDAIFVVLEGDFGRDKLAKFCADFFAFAPLKEGKHEFWRLLPAGNDPAWLFVQADKNHVLCCQSKDVLLKALNRDKPVVREKLIEVAKQIDPKATLWMAAAPREMDEYVSAHASVIVTDGLMLRAAVTTKDADAARNMASDLREEMKDRADLLDDAAKQLPPLAAVRDVLKNIEPKAAKNVVTFEVGLSGASIDKSIKPAP